MRQKTILTQKTQIVRLKEVMFDRIGKNNSVTRGTLITKIFPQTTDPFEKFYYERALNRMCHYLRKTTNYFVVNERFEDTQIYYILKTHTEYMQYKTGVNNNIKGLKDMIKKAKNHVTKKKWKDI